MTMKQRLDLTGKRFGRYVVLKFLPDKTSHAKYLCKCDCGNESEVFAFNLKQGTSKSCGCFQKELATLKGYKHGHTKNKSFSPTYSSWSSMFNRCNSNRKEYQRYKDKNIKVCERWKKFENFLSDMGERPEKSSLDRIDNSKGYSKENCRWATRKEQQLNRDNNLYVIKDNKLTLVQTIIDDYGLKGSLVRAKAQRRNWDFAAAFKTYGIECSNIKDKYEKSNNPSGN